MTNFWAAATDGKLVFAYRARNWNENRFLNSTELTAVAALAADEAGAAIAVTQQPSYVAALSGYVGWIDGSALLTKRFVSLKLTPTLHSSLPAGWAPVKTYDVRISDHEHEILQRIGEADDPAGTATTGSVMGKLNAALSEAWGDVQFVGTRPVR